MKLTEVTWSVMVNNGSVWAFNHRSAVPEHGRLCAAAEPSVQKHSYQLTSTRLSSVPGLPSRLNGEPSSIPEERTDSTSPKTTPTDTDTDLSVWPVRLSVRPIAGSAGLHRRRAGWCWTGTNPSAVCQIRARWCRSSSWRIQPQRRWKTAGTV